MWLLDVRKEPNRGSHPLEGGDSCGEGGLGDKSQSGTQGKNDLDDGLEGRRLEASPMRLRQSGAIGARKKRSTRGNRTQMG